MRGEGGGVRRQSASRRASADPIPFTPLWHPCSLRISYLALPLPRLGERVGVRGVSPKRDLCRPPTPALSPSLGRGSPAPRDSMRCSSRATFSPPTHASSELWGIERGAPRLRILHPIRSAASYHPFAQP